MTYSIDFRRKVLDIKDRDGLSFEETVLCFGVSKSSVSRWEKRFEPCLTKIHSDRLIHDVEQHPDAYQHEEQFGCSQRGICEALKLLNISMKKTFFHQKSDEDERNIFKNKVIVYELMLIIFIYSDESGFPEDISRIFCYAPAEVRCFGEHDVMLKRLMLLAH